MSRRRRRAVLGDDRRPPTIEERRQLVQSWRDRATELERQAKALRLEGDPHGARDLEAAATDCRSDADYQELLALGLEQEHAYRVTLRDRGADLTFEITASSASGARIAALQLHAGARIVSVEAPE